MRRSDSLTAICLLQMLVIVSLCAARPAQESLLLSGRVSDSKGGPIPAAGVIVSNASGPIAETLTELDGTFKFDVPPGKYSLAFEIVGFLKKIEEIDASESSRPLEIRLDPRPAPSIQQSFKPPSQPDRQPGVQPEDSAAFQSASVTDLPGLNLYQDDGARQAGDSTGFAALPENLLFISGNSANLDSGDFNNPGFRDQIMSAARMMGFQVQEFTFPGGDGRITAAGPPGEMGPGPGGGPPGGPGFVGMMGRGGRGAGFRQAPIQGSLSETYSNSALNARSYSLTGQKLPKPVQIQNNFGITVGGTLPFFRSQSPGQDRGDRRGGPGGFGRIGGQPGWTVSYSGNRSRSALDVLTTVPTDLERNGDFSQTFIQTLETDPTTGRASVVVQPVKLYLDPSNPASRFTKIESVDPIAQQLLQFIPRANLPCAQNAPCVNNYALQRSLPTSSDQIQASVTGLRVSSKDNLGVNYSMRRGSSLNAAIFDGLDTTRTNSGQNIGISGTHAFQPRLIANWRISLNRTSIESSNAFAYKRNVEGELGITGVSQEPINWGPPTISFTNYGSLSLASPSLSRNQTFAVSAGINKIGTKHSIRGGADINWVQRNSRSDSNGRGTFTFNGYATILFDQEGRQVPGTGHDLADFLLGLPYSTSRRYVDPAVNPQGNSIYLRNRSWNFYIMDNWRVGSRLTLNYGIRYEYTGPGFEKYDRMVTLDASPDFTLLEQVFPNQTGPISGHHFSRSLVNADRNNIAPRVGLAWKPTARSPFVFRAGYGIGYSADGFGSIVNQLVNQAPFALNQNLSSDRARPLTLAVGFPENPELTILNTYAIDPAYHAAYAQQWNLDVQFQFLRLYALTAAYSGSKGTGLDITRAPNRSGNAANFMYLTNGGSSIYHGLSLQLSRRFSRGFNFTTAYALSKSIDNTPSGVAQNDASLAAERALSSQDQRHNFQINYGYELPIGQNRRFFAGADPKLLNFIAGWTINGNLTLASGNPLTARYASSSGSASGAALYNALRPDATGLNVVIPKEQRTLLKYFNTAAFAIPAGEYGNAGRNTIPGPGSFLMNLSVRKSIRLDDSNRRVDFSWQVQNLLNHPNWGGLSTTVNALNFGQVTSMRPMRSMTMNLRINF